MTVALWLLLGVALAVPYIAVGLRLGGRTARLWWGVGLIVAAGLYVVFAVVRNAPLAAVLFESFGALGYGLAAVRGIRGDPRWLAGGWALHPVWDLAPHLPQGVPLAPEWYPWACLSFDLLVATALWWSWRTPLGVARTSFSSLP